jgi:hypothetical protein
LTSPKTAKSSYKKDIFASLEGFYITKAMVYLGGLNFFTNQKKRKQLINSGSINDILLVLENRTDIIKEKEGKYFLNPKYEKYGALQFHIDKFIGAYETVERTPKIFRLKVNQSKFADAYEKIEKYEDWRIILAILSALKAKVILDLGCGMGGLLVNFCKHKKGNIAIGIDSNSYLINRLKKLVHQKGMSDQIFLINEKVQNIDRIHKSTGGERIEVIIGSSIFNEFCQNDGVKLVNLLTKLKRRYSGAHLIISDYYGVLGRKKVHNAIHLEHSYLHDIMQLFTRQGVPPYNLQGWLRYYKRASCKLIHAYEGTNGGFNWFIHILQL